MELFFFLFIFSAVFAIFTGIFSRRSLKKQMLLFQELVHSIPQSVLFLDNTRCIRFASAAFLEQNSATESEIIGRHLSEVLGAQKYRSLREQAEPLFSGAYNLAEITFVSSENETQHREESLSYEGATLFPLRGEQSGYLCVFDDGEGESVVAPEQSTITELTLQRYLSELEQSRAKIKAQSEDLAEARDQAIQATKAKSAFLAGMSHEIRTPMNGVIGMTELLSETELTQEQRDYTSTILGSAESLLTIINDLLDFSKIEAGKLELSDAVYSPHDTLQQVANLFRFQLQEKRICFQLKMHGELPKCLYGDDHRLRQIVTNLMSNAIKFTPENGEISLEYGILKNGADAPLLQISVADTGIGIPKSAQKKIFEAFQQAEASTSRKFAGTGLGLSICVKLVEMMGGSIWLESEENVGSTFHFTVAARTPTDEQMAEYAKEQGGGDLHKEKEQRSLRVLLVEDNAVNQKLAKKVLEKLGHDAIAAENGEKALEALKDGEFDIVLMDCHMPVLDGYEATRRLRKIEEDTGSARMPVIALTANSMEGDRQKCLDAGMDDFLSKPFSKNDLQRLLLEYS
ncbi:ATP-binding protein [bacterium]|nr:ATP-binding protein [bacterium]